MKRNERMDGTQRERRKKLNAKRRGSKYEENKIYQVNKEVQGKISKRIQTRKR
jgi:hypothetical protein